MPIVEFAGQSAQNQEAQVADSSRLLNVYREAVSQGGLTRYLLKPVMGQTIIANDGIAFVRDMAWIEGTVYAAAGGYLYTIAPDGTTVNVGKIKDDEDTTISGNTGYVTICAGGRYFVLDGGVISEPPPGAFSSFGSVETIGTYTLLTEKNGRRVQVSDVADPKTLGGLSFATTESRSDNNIRGMELAGNYWIFKQRSTEVWVPTGSSDLPFSRLGSGVIGTGLKAFNLICRARDMLFFIGSDGLAHITSGQAFQPVSSRPVEQAIKVNDPTHCFYYEDEGHKFCVIAFSDRPAWVFDISTGEWHERSETEAHTSWDAIASVQETTGTWLVASRLRVISRLENITTDKGAHLFRRVVSRTLRLDSKRFRVPQLEIYGAYGFAPVIAQVFYYLGLGGGYVGFPNGAAYDMGQNTGSPEPKIEVKISRDGGITFNTGRSYNLGAQGEYNQRVLLRSLGQFRTMTIQVDMTHSYNIPIYSDLMVKVA